MPKVGRCFRCNANNIMAFYDYWYWYSSWERIGINKKAWLTVFASVCDVVLMVLKE